MTDPTSMSTAGTPGVSKDASPGAKASTRAELDRLQARMPGGGVPARGRVCLRIIPAAEDLLETDDPEDDPFQLPQQPQRRGDDGGADDRHLRREEQEEVKAREGDQQQDEPGHSHLLVAY